MVIYNYRYIYKADQVSQEVDKFALHWQLQNKFTDRPIRWTLGFTKLDAP
jgi:hypothetical protein